MTDDYILRVSAANGMVRAFFASTRHMVGEAAAIHNTTPTMSAALGRLLTSGAIMGQMLKGCGDMLTLSVKGDGPAGMILVTADSRGNVKGYAACPGAELPLNRKGKLDVSGVIGNGTLTVIKDIGEKEPYNGSVALQSGEIAEDVAFYFAQSEQVPSAVSLGVLVDTDRSIKQAGGFIIQLMPGASEDTAQRMERDVQSLDSLTNLYEKNHTPESLADLLFAGCGYEILDKSAVRYACNCSKERVEKALVSMGNEELLQIIEQEKLARVSCHFCNKEYVFNEDELRGLIGFLD